MVQKFLPMLLLIALCCDADVYALGETEPVVDNKPVINQAAARLKDNSTVDGLLQVTLGLFAVLVIIAGSAWIAKRFGQFHLCAGGHLKIVGGLHMGARERLVLVQVGDKQLLLGVSPGRVNTLYVLDEPLPAEPATEAGEGFAARLAEVLRQRTKR